MAGGFGGANIYWTNPIGLPGSLSLYRADYSGGLANRWSLANNTDGWLDFNIPGLTIATMRFSTNSGWWPGLDGYRLGGVISGTNYRWNVGATEVNISGTGGLTVASAGNKITGIYTGTVVLTAGVGSVVNANTSTTSIIVPTVRSVGGTIAGMPVVQAFTGSFVFTGAATDTSTYSWIMFTQ